MPRVSDTSVSSVNNEGEDMKESSRPSIRIVIPTHEPDIHPCFSQSSISPKMRFEPRDDGHGCAAGSTCDARGTLMLAPH